MGFQDRDYYREWWAKKEGFIEKTPFRMNLGRAKKAKQWHPVLVFLLTFLICLGVFVVLRLVLRFLVQ